ncbi:MAG: L-ribulose-5-phosphate 4-epimerase AraD [Flavobacteriaceae bacterium]|jgi:L-ribulose-5-phosphate 4-epimerase|nr:L-ribulose-5-phosphate 4-epimerase AraD [Flavobacteriaceae bacterium]
MGKYSYIKNAAYEGNLLLPKLDLVLFTWGNVSVADHDEGVFAIKPSGIPYEKLTVENMVIVDFEGDIVEGNLRPSSDTPTHAVLYQHWNDVNSIVHTHSTYATAWAQAQLDIPIFGTTHADHATTDIPCAPPMSDDMIKGEYEYQTGFQILNILKEKKLNHKEMEMVLVGNHAPFTWGNTVEKAVYNSAVLENIAKMAYLSRQINPNITRLKEALINKHYERKHGVNAYYGQEEKQINN